MNKTKFTMNSFVLVVMIASALFLFFTIFMDSLANRTVLNQSYPIEGTPYYVRYTTHIPSGIYDSYDDDNALMIKGSYGYDWAGLLIDDFYFCNEYHKTVFGFMTSNVVRISLKDFSKQIVLEDATIKGRCSSGELVCFGDVLMPNWFPGSNALCKLYGAAIGCDRYDSETATVSFIDPETLQMLYSVKDQHALSDERGDYYLSSSLQEIKE